MSTSRDDDPNKPVTGYPYPPPQSTYPPNGYPPPPQTNYHQSTTGTGYPYTAPPPASYYNNPNPNPNPYPSYPSQPYDPRRAAFLRRMIIAMISVFILFGAITFIFWLIFRPQVPQFQLQSASLSNFNTSSTQLTANFDVTFYVRNPNKKMTAVYDRIDGLVYYRRDLLSETSIAPFVQDTKSDTTVKAKLGTSETYLGDGLIGKMRGERSSGAVQFHFRLGGWVRFKSSTWRTRSHFLRVFCDDVSIQFSSANSSNGTMLGGPKKCDVDL